MKKEQIEEIIELSPQRQERIYELTMKKVKEEKQNQRRRPMRIALIAAAAVLGCTVIAGAVYRATREDMGYYVEPELWQEERQQEAAAEHSLQTYIEHKNNSEGMSITEEDLTTEDCLKALPVMTEKEETARYQQYLSVEEKFQDEELRKLAEESATNVYNKGSLWDAAVEDACFENCQENGVFVVLFLSDGCGYRMLLDAETLELKKAIPLTEEIMEGDRFRALRDGKLEEYVASQNGVG